MVNHNINDNNERYIQQNAAKYLQQLGYKYTLKDVTVKVGRKTVIADTVVYLDSEFSKPHIVVEFKQNFQNELSILDSAVQQAFAIATILGEVKFLLITDGQKFEWFKRNSHTQSLENLTSPPKSNHSNFEEELYKTSLLQISDSKEYLQILSLILDIFRNGGMNFGILMAISLNQLIIAKLHDEKLVADGKSSKFTVNKINSEETVSQIQSLYEEVLFELGDRYYKLNDWNIPSQILLSAVKVLEPYSLHSVTKNIRNRSFWQLFPQLLGRNNQQYITPLPVAKLMVELVKPKRNEAAIDLACGSGLFLLEIIEYIETQQEIEFLEEEDIRRSTKNIIGIELNKEVAELAATNFILNGISSQQIINDNSLTTNYFERENYRTNGFDIVITNPPIGVVSIDQIPHIKINNFRFKNKVNSEFLFIIKSLEILKEGGRLAILVSDSFLNSPKQIESRRWLLENIVIRAIISLPPETFVPVGHYGKASILLIENRGPRIEKDGKIFFATIDSIGYDRLGRPTRENDIPILLKAFNEFQQTNNFRALDNYHKTTGSGNLKLQQLTAVSLIEKGTSPSNLNSEANEIINTLKNGENPVVRLKDIAEIFSGQNFKSYVEKNDDGVVLIQAKSVREGRIDLSEAPYLSTEDYSNVKRSQVFEGDVLITNIGSYLGRTAVVEKLYSRAIASSSVTILRLNDEIDPYFLAFVLNSIIGIEQVKKLQAQSTAQPYIRRNDLGEIIVPLPPLEKQKSLANRASDLLDLAEKLLKEANELEARAKAIITSEFLVDNSNE